MKISRTMLAAAVFFTLGTVGVAQAQTNAAQDATGAPTAPAATPQAGRYHAQTAQEGKTRDQRNTERAQAAGAGDGAAANRAQSTNGRRAFHDGRKLDELFLTQP